MADKFKYTDEELILKFQNGDEYAYLELVKRYRDKLMNFIFRYFGNKEDAEDIVQETCIKLYTHKHYYREIAKFSTWIYTIAANLAKTELRKRKRRKVSYLSQMGLENKDYDIPTNDNFIEYTEGRLSEEEIQNTIMKLPLHFRSAVILRDIQELSYEDISKILDVPLGTVKSRINRARLQLQNELEHINKSRRSQI